MQEHISNLSQLAFAADLTNEQKVLQFVRIETAPTVCFHFQPHPLEILPIDGLPANWALTDDFPWSGIPKWRSNGYEGLVTSPSAVKFASMFPRIEHKAGLYRVIRLVLNVHFDELLHLSFAPQVLVEDVYPAGIYQFLSLTTIDPPELRDVRWSIFQFM